MITFANNEVTTHVLLVQHEKFTTCLPQEIHSGISLPPFSTLVMSLFVNYARSFYLFFIFIRPPPKPILGLAEYLRFEIVDKRHVSQWISATGISKVCYGDTTVLVCCILVFFVIFLSI